MIHVKSIHIHPVKSCRGISLDTAEVTATGFRYDRRWMVVGGNGDFLSQRNHPVMATVTTRIENHRLVLGTADLPELEINLQEPQAGSRTVKVWKDRCRAVSEGPAAERWFSSLLDTRCELVRQIQAEHRPVDSTYADPGDVVSFADGFPFLLISQASMDDLNRRIDHPVSADRFRANLVLSGGAPFAEDGWKEIEIGDIGFRIAKPCARCIIVSTDQTTGMRTAEPLNTLAEYRSKNGKVLFGQNLIHDGAGPIRVGDAVRITKAS